MANEPIGNNILEGPLGVVDVIFDGVYLGRTTADTEITAEEDNKEIIYQQDGTKPDDLIPTGISYMVAATFGEIDSQLLTKVQRGFAGNVSSGKFGRDIYVSRKEGAKVIQIIRVDSEGQRSTDPKMKMTFYLASPEVTGPIQYGADTQRNLPVNFYIFYNKDQLAFGYFGNASSVGLVPAA
jgi:hypothetical protein